MDITPLVPKGKQIITGYGSGQFRIGGQVYNGNVLIFPDRTVTWTIAPKAPISVASLEVVIEEEGEVDLLLIGSGKLKASLPLTISAALKEAGISLEVMDTGGAVRTYNVLLAEGRRVAAALLAV